MTTHRRRDRAMKHLARIGFWRRDRCFFRSMHSLQADAREDQGAEGTWGAVYTSTWAVIKHDLGERSACRASV